MRVTAVEVYRKDLPLLRPFQHSSSGIIRALEEVYVVLRTDGEAIGLGEARGNSHYLTGDTPGKVAAEILNHLAPRLIGRDPQEAGAILGDLDALGVGRQGARSAVDIALHDLVGKVRGVPVFELLGGAVRDALPSNQTLFFGSPEAAAQQAAAYIAEGFRYLKVRVGLRPFQRDLDRVRAVREAVGPEVSLAIDANMAWEAGEAVRFLRRLEPFHLAYVEQPVPRDDLAGMRSVTQRGGVPVMADESVQSLGDAFLLARERAADILHFKLNKLGGIANLRRAAAVAEAAGLQIMVGQTNEGGLATSAAAHCAKAVRAAYLELYGAEGLAEDPARGFALKGGMATFPVGPGLGVTLDVASLRPCGAVQWHGRRA